MKTFNLGEITPETEDEIISAIKAGKIFVYPTDTIYGLGCNAENTEAVKKIKEIKSRDAAKPMSVIAPSMQWILDNMKTNEKYVKMYLPGPYTLILKKKDSEFLNEASSYPTLGVRIPSHKFTEIIQKTGVPFITTSVNLSGEKPLTNTSALSEEIKEKIDYVIDSGELNGKPSTLILNGQSVMR
ncbi:MAG: L-threonylcarbamoyladenylate synthase [archaeon]